MFSMTLAFVGVAALTANASLAAQTSADQATSNGDKQATTDEFSSGSSNEKQKQNTQPASESTATINDFDLAAWLIVQHENQVAISAYAAQHADREAVRKFAREVEQLHNELIAELHEPSVLGQPSVGWNLGDILHQLGDIADGLPGVRVRVITRGEVKPSDSGAKSENEDAEVPPAEGTSSPLPAARADRQDGLWKQALPVIERTLPKMLDLVATALDDGSLTRASLERVQLHHRVAAQTAERLQSDLSGLSGAAFDHVYLGAYLAQQHRLISFVETCQPLASKDLLPLVAASQEDLQGELKKARALFRKDERKDKNSSD
jgi:hypothetical protein